MVLVLIFDINQDIIEVDKDKNIKFFEQDLINKYLKISSNIKKSKKYYLILKISVLLLESSFLFVNLYYSYMMINAHEVLLGKLVRPPKLV